MQTKNLAIELKSLKVQFLGLNHKQMDNLSKQMDKRLRP